jgi:hypothetical protein
MTRESFVALFASLDDAVGFEEYVLGAVGTDHPEIDTADYWQWLAEQKERME